MSFCKEMHQMERSRQIEQIFIDNKDQILADLDSLELTIREIAAKWNVNDRNVRRFAEKEGLDLDDRQARRRVSGYQKRHPNRVPKPSQQDAVRSAKLLSMRW